MIHELIRVLEEFKISAWYSAISAITLMIIILFYCFIGDTEKAALIGLPMGQQ